MTREAVRRDPVHIGKFQVVGFVKDPTGVAAPYLGKQEGKSSSTSGRSERAGLGRYQPDRRQLDAVVSPRLQLATALKNPSTISWKSLPASGPGCDVPIFDVGKNVGFTHVAYEALGCCLLRKLFSPMSSRRRNHPRLPYLRLVHAYSGRALCIPRANRLRLAAGIWVRISAGLELERMAARHPYRVGSHGPCRGDRPLDALSPHRPL